MRPPNLPTTMSDIAAVAAIAAFFAKEQLPDRALSETLPFNHLAAGADSPLTKARKEPTPENIKKAIKSRVIAPIALNAAWGAAFGGWQ
ncbi:hypothetical protein [Rhodoflexus sp.]